MINLLVKSTKKYAENNPFCIEETIGIANQK